MKIAILDDYFDTLRTLPCFANLSAFEVVVFNDPMQDEARRGKHRARGRGPTAAEPTRGRPGARTFVAGGDEPGV